VRKTLLHLIAVALVAPSFVASIQAAAAEDGDHGMNMYGGMPGMAGMGSDAVSFAD